MARKVSKRTIVNYHTLDAIRRGFVNGMGAVGAAIIENTRPPDAAPFGEGLVTTGDWGVWAGSRKVAGTASKPGSVRLAKDGGITLIAGYGFPGRYQEIGTVNQPARPFLTPPVLAELPVVPEQLAAPVQAELRGVR